VQGAGLRRGQGNPRRVAAIALIAATALMLFAALASAELTEKGGIFVSFNGGISPKALPRHKPAPIAVRIEGMIRAGARHDPPPLRSLEIALNRGGQLDTRGLPLCRRSQISSATTARALSICRRSLVGSGGIVIYTSIPDQPTNLLRGDLVLFNSRDHGRPAILGYVYQGDPPATYTITFDIRHTAGAFGTVIDAKLPAAINPNGYLKSIFLVLQRNYTYRGRQHSYLSAACAAPPGFLGAVFPLARASMTFAGGRTLSATLIRSCKVSR
jgi:hypothetical protein